ncbi:MAG: leucine-rich repeat domain-containing protein [Gammaproteobacteria bacterium]|nr:leucine-rich repeat domain-containing protein [Gammaproteobacteria bacterium]
MAGAKNMCKILVVISFLFISQVTIANTPKQDAIDGITDANLSTCIQNQLASYTYAEELINLSCYDVASLEGLNAFTELNYLGIDGTVSDISPLNGLEKLANLYLYANELSTLDVNTLDSLTSLKELAVTGNNLASFPQTTTMLEVLYMGSNPSVDLSGLSNQVSLKTLRITYSELSDISALSSLTSLETLELYQNNISDVSALSYLINLNYLDISNNKITDIGPLDNLSLSHLGMSDNQIRTVSNYSNLSNYSSLNSLSMRRNYIHCDDYNMMLATKLETQYLSLDDICNDDTTDRDNDGLTDYFELDNGLDPHIANYDVDNDGLDNAGELELGRNPLDDSDIDQDSNDNGYSDLHEYLALKFSNGNHRLTQYDVGTELLLLQRDKYDWKATNTIEHSVEKYSFLGGDSLEVVNRLGVSQSNLSNILSHLKITPANPEQYQEDLWWLACEVNAPTRQVKVRQYPLFTYFFDLGLDESGNHKVGLFGRSRLEFPDNPECEGIELPNFGAQQYNSFRRDQLATNKLVNSGKYYLHLPARNNQLIDNQKKWSTNLLELFDDQTGFDHFNQELVDWGFNSNDGLTVYYSDGAIANYYSYYNDVDNNASLSFMEYSDGVSNKFISLSGKAEDNQLNLSEDEYISRFQYESLVRILNYPIAFTFTDDNLRKAENFYCNYIDDCQYPSWSYWDLNDESWIFEDGQMNSYRYFSNTFPYHSAVPCDGSDESCYLRYKRTSKILSKSGNRYIFYINLEIDSNNDGVFTVHDSYVASFYKTERDIDLDGLPDVWEQDNGLNLLDASDAAADADADGLTNSEEYHSGTNHLVSDTDGDGLLDGEDILPLDRRISTSSSKNVYSLSDITGDGVSELGLLSMHVPSNRWSLNIRNGATNAFVKTFFWSAESFEGKDLVVLHDITGDGVRELGLFGYDSSKSVWSLSIKNGKSGAWLRRYDWSKEYTDASVSMIEDQTGNGIQEVALFGRSKSDGNWKVDVLRGNNGNSLFEYSWSSDKYEAVEFAPLWDLNGDGRQDIGMFAKDLTTLQWSLLVKDSANGNTLKRYDWGGSLELPAYAVDEYPSPLVHVFPDVTGNGQPEVGIFMKNTNDRFVMSVKEGQSGGWLKGYYWKADLLEGKSFHILDDYNNDGHPEVGIFAYNTSLQEPVLQIKNGKNGTWLRNYRYGAGQEIHRMLVVPDMTGNGRQEVGMFGKNTQTGKWDFTLLNGNNGNVLNVFSWNALKFQ